ncbi:unnamed protein product [Echinostoma caproni]|uniref:Uncharacterized protein n=1 Tax=Echinostoma caproni TaxID=27848 RepID=A0A3P8H4Q5_9TREM|nr:unnamed protein product [Echinostoma caproni]
MDNFIYLCPLIHQPKRRLVLDDDDEEENDEEVAAKKVAHESHDDREVIARQIFEDEDDEEMPSGRTMASKPANFRVTGEDEEEEEEEGEYDGCVLNLTDSSPSMVPKGVIQCPPPRDQIVSPSSRETLRYLN